MTLEWKLRELRPVGEAVTLRVTDRPVSQSKIGRYFPDPVIFYQSGTAALAAALMACKAARRAGHPEVLLPAYACPDLLSAVDYAGLRPVLVDFEENRPWMSMTDLANKVNGNTVAVIAVNFLGIPERISEIRRVTDKKEVFLIEDRAQSLPENFKETDSGDLVVLSFGKGKPVTVLHGGALMIKRRELNEFVARPERVASESALSNLKQYLKIAAYNMLIHPRCFWALKYFPMLRLGETRYKPLSAIEPMKPICMAILEENIRNFHARVTRGAFIREMLASLRGGEVTDLPGVCGHGEARLLRYPLLLRSATQRDECLRLLKAKGLGASTMYPGVLPTIEGVNLPATVGTFPNAEAFAARLLTLPLHSDVTPVAVNEIKAVIHQCLR